MPSILPSYVYTLFASIIVGTLIIGMCGLSVAGIKRGAEAQKLASITEYVASKSIELASQPPTDNLTSTVQLDIPDLVGNQRYWIQILNDTSKTWVEAGFGTTIIAYEQKATIPLQAVASGYFVSGSGRSYLTCTSDSNGVHLTLNGGN